MDTPSARASIGLTDVGMEESMLAFFEPFKENLPLAVAMFQNMDRDSTGALSLEEFTAGVRSYDITPEQAKRIFRFVDEDHSGSITISELYAFVSHVQQCQARSEEIIQQEIAVQKAFIGDRVGAGMRKWHLRARKKIAKRENVCIPISKYLVGFFWRIPPALEADKTRGSIFDDASTHVSLEAHLAGAEALLAEEARELVERADRVGEIIRQQRLRSQLMQVTRPQEAAALPMQLKLLRQQTMTDLMWTSLQAMHVQLEPFADTARAHAEAQPPSDSKSQKTRRGSMAETVEAVVDTAHDAPRKKPRWLRFAPSLNTTYRVQYARYISLCLMVAFCAFDIGALIAGALNDTEMVLEDGNTTYLARRPLNVLFCKHSSVPILLSVIAVIVCLSSLAVLILACHRNVFFLGIAWGYLSPISAILPFVATILRTIAYINAYTDLPEAFFTSERRSSCSVITVSLSLSHMFIFTTFVLSDLFYCRAPWLRVTLTFTILPYLTLELLARSGPVVIPEEDRSPTSSFLDDYISYFVQFGGSEQTTQNLIRQSDFAVILLLASAFSATLMVCSACR